MEKSKFFISGVKVLALTSAFALTVGTGAAFASLDAEMENDTTGPNSENLSIIESELDIDVDVENDAELENEVEVEVNTGWNDTKHNTTVEDVSTGDIEVEIIFENEANTASVLAMSGPDGDSTVEVEATNHLTGPWSENINKVEADRDIDIDIENKAEIENEIEIDANTGGNDIEENTTVGDVSTGDIDITARTNNVANANAPVFDLCDNCLLGDIEADLSNDTTGPNSENKNIVEADTDIDVDIENKAEIENEFEIDANTGKNDVTGNTSVGDVSTGDISITISARNVAN